MLLPVSQRAEWSLECSGEAGLCHSKALTKDLDPRDSLETPAFLFGPSAS